MKGRYERELAETRRLKTRIRTMEEAHMKEIGNVRLECEVKAKADEKRRKEESERRANEEKSKAVAEERRIG